MTEQIDQQSKEDQLVAALAHGGVFVPTFGALIPLIVWLTQKERSDLLKKQALQAAVWQIIYFVIQILLAGCYFLSFFAIVPLSIIGEEAEFLYVDPSSGGAIAGGFLILFTLIVLIFGGGWFVYLGFGIAGAVQMLRGKDFNYPIIGRWVDNRLTADEAIKAKAPEVEPQPTDSEPST